MDKIERLKRRVKDRADERQRLKDTTQEARDRARAIREAPDRLMYDFYCTDCASDFTGPAWKDGYTRHSVQYAWYTGFCPLGHKAIRHITDKHWDAYYHLSDIMRHQRQEFADALLTPADPRFRKLYPAQWRKIEEEREASEQLAQHHAGR